MDEQRHAGRRVIVTGAASGIGYAAAVRFVREGATVTACDVGEEGLTRLQSEVGDVGGTDRLSVVSADITRQADVERVVELASAGGPIDVLANVAGIMDAFVPLHELDDELWERLLAVNVTGAMRFCRAVVPAMLAAGRGAIVNVASRAAVSGGPAGPSYVTSKHAVLGLSRSIAASYAPAGIRCNTVCPGGVETGIATTATPRDAGYLERWMPLLGTQLRTAQPDEIAAAVSWLASDEASNVNGAVLTADGGWTAQ